jgi:hypothetical protein
MTDWTAARPSRHGEAWVQRDGAETAVYNADTGQLHLLNASARAIWDLCDGDTLPEEMAAAITDLTGLDGSVAWVDVVTTLERLAELGLIRSD